MIRPCFRVSVPRARSECVSEDRHLERQRHSQARRASCSSGWRARSPMSSACRKSRRQLDQLTFESARRRRLLEPLARRQGLLGRRAARVATRLRRRRRPSSIRSSTSSSASARRRWRRRPARSRSRRCTCPTAARTSPPRCDFLEGIETWVARSCRRPAGRWSSAATLNVARSDMDIHPKERKPNQVGARPDERALFEQILVARSGRRRPHARSDQREPLHLVGAVAQPAAAQHRLAHRLRPRVSGGRREGQQRRRAARSRHERSRAGRRGVRSLTARRHSEGHEGREARILTSERARLVSRLASRLGRSTRWTSNRSV